jgi:hypothetical protein
MTRRDRRATPAMVDSTPPKRGFLIMPFDPAFDWLRAIVVNASVSKGVDTRRSDDIFSPGVVLDQIMADIDSADVVVAVCTGRNPNVFFELGYAWKSHAPILIAKDRDDIPFDISSMRVEFYGTPGSNFETLQTRLEAAIGAVLASDRLPRGRRISEPPRVRQVSRLTARMDRSGSSRNVTITNSGTTDIMNVSVEVPPEVEGMTIHSEDLPIGILRSGESVRLPVLMVMGGGPRIFDLTLTGELDHGVPLTMYSKVSL